LESAIEKNLGRIIAIRPDLREAFVLKVLRKDLNSRKDRSSLGSGGGGVRTAFPPVL
jgi:hypothetical protein